MQSAKKIKLVEIIMSTNIFDEHNKFVSTFKY